MGRRAQVESAGARAVRLINQLTHTKGPSAGQPFDLRPWQQRIIKKLFTTRRDGLRQYRTCLLMLPRKNGKSATAAALAIYFLMFDHETGAEVYSAAADRDQASLVFNVAAQMIRNDPELLAACEIVESQKRIVHRASGSFYKAISAEAYCLAPDTMIDRSDGRRVMVSDARVGDEIVGWDGRRLAVGCIRSIEEQRPAQLYRIRTARGRTIVTTGEHPFLAMTHGRRVQDQTHRYVWARAKHLRVGTRVRVGLGDAWRSSVRVPALEAWAMGAWTGDGECGRFRFISADDEIVQRMRLQMEAIGSTLRSEYSTRQRQGASPGLYPQEHHVVGLGRRRESPGREWVRQHFGQDARSHTKRIPAYIWGAGRDAWAAFMAGWLDTDGCVPAMARQVTWVSMSDGLLHDGQAILARLGVNACVNLPGHMLSVNGREQVQHLWRSVASHMALTRKRERLRAHAERPSRLAFDAHETDRIVSIEDAGIGPSLSIEVDGTDTHVTNGIITHNSKHGFNASAVIYDELHAAPNRELWDVLSTSQGARAQPLMMAITTAGHDRHSILWELYQHAKKVAENPKLDPTFLPILYEAPIDADWTDEKVWKQANPALGDFRSLEEMRTAAARAKQIPAQENTFRRLYLNQWTEQAERWIAMPEWDACQAEVDLDALRGRRCYLGMDLSTTTDLTALVALFPDDDGAVTVIPAFFVPADNMARREAKDHVPYAQWAREGYLTATPGNTVDYEAVRAQIQAWDAIYDVQKIGYDPWNATDLVTRLKDQDGFECVPLRQGFFSLSAPTKALEVAILNRTLRHTGHPVLRWNMSNASVEEDPAGNRKLSKKRSTERIDGAMALVMALDCVNRYLPEERWDGQIRSLEEYL